MYVQSIQPRRGHKLDLSSVVAVSGGAAGLESELLRDVLLLLRPQSREHPLETEGTAAMRVLEDAEFVPQLTPERLLDSLRTLLSLIHI